jgi:hypothetical protein
VTVSIDVGLAVKTVPFIDSSASADEEGFVVAIGIFEVDEAAPTPSEDDEI